jgi:hypothetical protein
MSTPVRKIAGFALLGLAVGGLVYATAGRKQPLPQEPQPLAQAEVKAPAKESSKSFAAQPVDQSWQAPAQKSQAAAAAPVSDYGHTPETPKELLANPQAQSNLEALKDPTKFPERLNPMIAGAPFDAARWANDPAYKAAYLAVAEPSRGFAGSKDPKAPRLERVSAMNPIVAQDEKIELSVRASPGAPVSFFSPHLNRFENGLTSITVVADAQGLATVTMEGVPGTIGPTDVVASSPLNSGSVTIKVETTQANVQASK